MREPRKLTKKERQKCIKVLKNLINRKEAELTFMASIQVEPVEVREPNGFLIAFMKPKWGKIDIHITGNIPLDWRS